MRLFLIPLLLISPLVLAHECQFSAERNLDIDPAGLSALRLEPGSGNLDVQGDPTATRIEVRGKACASGQAWLDELQVEQSRQGDKAVVKTAPQPAHIGRLSGNSYAYIDYVVRVPAKLALEVDAGSGDTRARRIASLDYRAGSGNLTLEHAAGPVKIAVGSGDVHVVDVRGEVTVGHAGSGNLSFSEVSGNLRADSIGSGGLSANKIGGSVRVGSIGSGNVVAEDIGGDVYVGSIGSGNVTAKTVGGGLTVRSAGSGRIRHSGVAGSVDVPKRHEND